MVSTSLSISAHTIFTDAAGVAGNIFAFGLFVSPVPTFRRIVRNRSTEQFSGLPYIYALLNCLLCAWYGTPIVSSNNTLVMTVNSVGAVFQLVYVSLFIAYVERARKMGMLGLLMAVFVTIGVIVFMSLTLFTSNVRRMFVGFLSCGSLISMFASPLSITVCIFVLSCNLMSMVGTWFLLASLYFIFSVSISFVDWWSLLTFQNLVIRTKSVEYMPFYLSLSTFLMSISFCLFGILNADPFVYVPNGIGVFLGVTQLVVYSYYKNRPSEDRIQPLIASRS